MKKMMSALLTSFMLISFVPTTLAANEDGSISNDQIVGSTVYPPEGGVWTYGYNFMDVFSDYFHQTNTHKSSCVGIGGHMADSGWICGGVKTESSWGIDPLGNNHWYYDVR